MQDHSRNRLIELLSDPSFLCWILGEANREETARWDQWKKDDPGHIDLYVKACQFVSKLNIVNAYDANTEYEWVRLARRINETDLQRQLGSFWSDRRLNYGIAAAVMFMTVSALLVWFFVRNSSPSAVGPSKLVVIQTAYGEQGHFTLPDGSTILLGAHSRLTHTKDWLKHKIIRVSLSGKAYFNITESGERSYPKLVITTRDGSISDWGTRFMVDTYRHRTRVILEKGDVSITHENSENPVDLQPGQMAEFSRSRKNIQISEVNTKVYTSWVTDRLVFDNTPLSEAIEYIENTYGMIVKTDDPELLNKKLTGELKHGSLDELTRAIGRVLTVQFIRSGDTLRIESGKRK